MKNRTLVFGGILIIFAVLVGCFSLWTMIFGTGLPIYRELPIFYPISAVFEPLKFAWSENYNLGYPVTAYFEPPGSPDFYHYGPVVFFGYYFLYFLVSLITVSKSALIFWILGIFLQALGTYLLIRFFAEKEKPLIVLASSLIAGAVIILSPYNSLSILGSGVWYSGLHGLFLIWLYLLWLIKKQYLSNDPKFRFNLVLFGLISFLFTNIGVVFFLILIFTAILDLVFTIWQEKEARSKLTKLYLFFYPLTLIQVLILDAYLILPNLANPTENLLTIGHYASFDPNDWTKAARLALSLGNLSPFQSLVLWLTPILTLIGLFFLPKKIRGFCLVLLVLGIFLTKGSAEPLVNLSAWIFQNLPLMDWYRASHRYLIFAMIASSLSLGFMSLKLLKQKSLVLRFLPIIIALVIIVFGNPNLFSGDADQVTNQIQIPSQYFQAKEWLEKNLQKDERFIYLPANSLSLSRDFQWSKSNTNSDSTWNDPLSSVLMPDANSANFYEVYKTYGSRFLGYFLENSDSNPASFYRASLAANIDYFILDHSIKPDNPRTLDIKRWQEILKNTNYFKLSQKIKDLEIYQTRDKSEMVDLSSQPLLVAGDLSSLKYLWQAEISPNNQIILLNDPRNDFEEIFDHCQTCPVIFDQNKPQEMLAENLAKDFALNFSRESQFNANSYRSWTQAGIFLDRYIKDFGLNFSGRTPLVTNSQNTIRKKITMEPGKYRLLAKVLMPKDQPNALTIKVGDQAVFNQIALVSSDSDKPQLEWLVSGTLTLNQSDNLIISSLTNHQTIIDQVLIVPEIIWTQKNINLHESLTKRSVFQTKRYQNSEVFGQQIDLTKALSLNLQASSLKANNQIFKSFKQKDISQDGTVEFTINAPKPIEKLNLYWQTYFLSELSPAKAEFSEDGNNWQKVKDLTSDEHSGVINLSDYFQGKTSGQVRFVIAKPNSVNNVNLLELSYSGLYQIDEKTWPLYQPSQLSPETIETEQINPANWQVKDINQAGLMTLRSNYNQWWRIDNKEPFAVDYFANGWWVNRSDNPLTIRFVTDYWYKLGLTISLIFLIFNLLLLLVFFRKNRLKIVL